MPYNSLELALNKSVENLRSELRGIRIGRANAALVEDIVVNAYGTKTPLVQLASIGVPQNNQLTIQPWDASLLLAIQEALRKPEVNLNPVVSGNIIIINIPPLTEETRVEFVKRVKKEGENARIAARNIREEVMKEIDDSETSGEISEDEKFRRREFVQKQVDACHKKIEEAVIQKEQDIMSS